MDVEPAPGYTLSDLQTYRNLTGPRGSHLPAGYLAIEYPGIAQHPATQTIDRWCRRNSCDLLALADFLIDERAVAQAEVGSLSLDRVADLLKPAWPLPPAPAADATADESAKGKSKRKRGKTANERMKEKAAREPDCRYWSVRKWMETLGVKSTDTIHRTPCWKEWMELKEEKRAGQIMRQAKR